MSRPLHEKLAERPAARAANIDKRVTEFIADEMSLREIRKAMGKAQAKVAKGLDVGQDSVARYEQRSDMLLSTSGKYIREVGGVYGL